MLKKLALLSIWLALPLCAQTINPNQVRPATTNGQVLTTVTANQPPSWQTPASGVSVATTPPCTVNGGTGPVSSGTATITCVNGIQMKYTPGGSGQHVLVFATSASCSGGSDNTCTYSGFALPSYVVQANVTAVYAIAISASTDIGGSELEAWQVTGGGAAWTGGQFNLVPGGAATGVWAPGQATVPASPLPTNYSGISFASEFCCHGDTVSVSMAALDIYYTGTAPPAYNPLLIQSPLNYNPQTNTLSLYSPFDAGYDFGAVNASQVIVPLLVNGPALGDQMTLIPGHTSTSTTPTVAVTNAALSGAYPIVNQDGSALAVGALVANVPILMQFDGAKWRLVGSAGSGGAVASVSNVNGSLTISPNIGAVVASLNVGNANTWTATQTFSQIIDTALVGTATSPVCPNGAGGALTQSGCTTGNGISSGSGYALPAYGSGASTTLGPSNITTDSTNNNLIVPGSGTFGSGGSTHGLTFPAGTCSAGVAGSVVYCTDGTNGYAQVNENNTGLVRLCDSTNGVWAAHIDANALGTPQYAAGGGTANAQTVTLSPSISSLSTGVHVRWNPSSSNTGATTLAVNAISAVSVEKCGSVALAAGDLSSGIIADATYDGTKFQLLNPAAVACAGGAPGVASITATAPLTANGVSGSAQTGPVTVACAGGCAGGAAVCSTIRQPRTTSSFRSAGSMMIIMH